MCSGYVINTLEAALWVFYNSENFGEGVNLGDDADTVGAVYGQLLWAYYGVDRIEKNLRENRYNGKMIEEIAVELFKLSMDTSI